ncbi:hypothetical protein RI367_008561 [Sorochytrium milnesiophthora]
MAFHIDDALSPMSVGFSYLFSFFMLCNVTLNILLVVVAKRGRLLNSAANVLIINLALADCGLALTCLPIWFSNAVAGRWITGQVGCYWNGFCTAYFVFNSVATLFLITAERYYTVVRMKRLERPVCLRILGAAWVVAIGYAMLPLLASSSRYLPQPSGTYCSLNWSSVEPSDAIIKVVICTMISSTVLGMVFAYYRIIVEFRRSQRDVLGAGRRTDHKTKGKVAPPSSDKAVTIAKDGRTQLPLNANNKQPAGPETPVPQATNLDSSGGSAKTAVALLQQAVDPTLAPSSSVEASGGIIGSLRRTVFRSTMLPLMRAKRSVSDRYASFSQSGTSSVGGGTTSMLSASQIAARNMEKMLIKRSVAVVGAFITCWCMYLFVWIYTWVYSPQPVPPLIDCFAALLVSMIGVVDPGLTFVLDNRFKSVLRDMLGLAKPASAIKEKRQPAMPRGPSHSSRESKM